MKETRLFEWAAAFLKEKWNEVKEHDCYFFGTENVDSIASELGCDRKAIAKTEFVRDQSGMMIVCLLPVEKEIDLEKMNETFHSNFSILTREEASEITGSNYWLQPPFPLSMKMRLILDRSLVFEPVLFIGEQDEGIILETPLDIILMLGMKDSGFVPAGMDMCKD